MELINILTSDLAQNCFVALALAFSAWYVIQGIRQSK